jgi:hypothetical protein
MLQGIVDARRVMRPWREVIGAIRHEVLPRVRFMAGLGINLIGATLLLCQVIARLSSPGMSP